MNNYKSFSDLKEELGNNYDFKLYEMGISALKEIENLQQENKQLKDNWNKVKEYIKQEPTLYFYNDKLPFEVIIAKIINKMQELEGSDSNGQ